MGGQKGDYGGAKRLLEPYSGGQKGFSGGQKSPNSQKNFLYGVFPGFSRFRSADRVLGPFHRKRV